MNERVLKHHITAATAALQGGPYPTMDAAAQAVADAVLNADGPVRWVVITDFGGATAYGPYASAETARKAINSGLMLGEQVMLLAMKPVPRAGHRSNTKENTNQ